MTDDQLAFELYTELYSGGCEADVEHHPDRLWGFGVASVRRSCLERPIATVALTGGAL